MKTERERDKVSMDRVQVMPNYWCLRGGLLRFGMRAGGKTNSPLFNYEAAIRKAHKRFYWGNSVI